MRGKTCLVTGASGALGKAVASALAQQGATVVMLCRERTRGEAARLWVQGTTHAPTDLLLCDLASQASVRQAAAEFLGRFERLHVLINNAAVYKGARTLTSDGLETMFATNYLGPFLLTHLLLDAMKASAPARVINISAPVTTRLDFDDLQGARRFRAVQAFGASKMGNLVFTFDLARRLEGSGVTVNAAHPGLVRSHLMRETPTPVRWLSAASWGPRLRGQPRPWPTWRRHPRSRA